MKGGFRGFTLLELLVATTLLFVLGGAVSVLLIRGLTVGQRSDAALGQLFLMEKGLGILSQEVRNAVSLTDRPFQGSKEEISFLSAESPIQIVDVRYHLLSQGDTRTWTREEAAFPKSQLQGSPIDKMLIPRVKSLSIHYATVEKVADQKVLRWVDEWPPSPQFQKLPKLLEVKMEAQDAQGKRHTLSRLLVIPDGALEIPSE